MGFYAGYGKDVWAVLPVTTTNTKQPAKSLAFLNLSESRTPTYPPSFNSDTQDVQTGSPMAEHRKEEELEQLGKKNEAKISKGKAWVLLTYSTVCLCIRVWPSGLQGLNWYLSIECAHPGRQPTDSPVSKFPKCQPRNCPGIISLLSPPRVFPWCPLDKNRLLRPPQPPLPLLVWTDQSDPSLGTPKYSSRIHPDLCPHPVLTALWPLLRCAVYLLHDL